MQHLYVSQTVASHLLLARRCKASGRDDPRAQARKSRWTSYFPHARGPRLGPLGRGGRGEEEQGGHVVQPPEQPVHDHGFAATFAANDVVAAAGAGVIPGRGGRLQPLSQRERPSQLRESQLQCKSAALLTTCRKTVHCTCDTSAYTGSDLRHVLHALTVPTTMPRFYVLSLIHQSPIRGCVAQPNNDTHLRMLCLLHSSQTRAEACYEVVKALGPDWAFFIRHRADIRVYWHSPYVQFCMCGTLSGCTSRQLVPGRSGRHISSHVRGRTHSLAHSNAYLPSGTGLGRSKEAWQRRRTARAWCMCLKSS